jgi:hypothetical protein
MKVHPWTTISGIFREMSGTSQPLGPQFWSILVNPWDPKLAKIRTRPHGGLSGAWQEYSGQLGPSLSLSLRTLEDSSICYVTPHNQSSLTVTRPAECWSHPSLLIKCKPNLNSSPCLTQREMFQSCLLCLFSHWAPALFIVGTWYSGVCILGLFY